MHTYKLETVGKIAGCVIWFIISFPGAGMRCLGVLGPVTLPDDVTLAWTSFPGLVPASDFKQAACCYVVSSLK